MRYPVNCRNADRRGQTAYRAGSVFGKLRIGEDGDLHPDIAGQCGTDLFAGFGIGPEVNAVTVADADDLAYLLSVSGEEKGVADVDVALEFRSEGFLREDELDFFGSLFPASA